MVRAGHTAAALGATAAPKSMPLTGTIVGRGVTIYKELPAHGVALTAEFAQGSEGDITLKWKGTEGGYALDASLVMPASGARDSMAATASAKRGAPDAGITRLASSA